MASPPAPAHRIAGAPAAQPALPDELLEDIFPRLDAAEDLARASAACTTFRRVVSAATGPSTPRLCSASSPPTSGSSTPPIRRTAPLRPPAPSRAPPTSPSPSSRSLIAGAPATFATAACSSPRQPPRSSASCSWSAAPW
ncbi:unnamed protein product [Urochloa humidicola]